MTSGRCRWNHVTKTLPSHDGKYWVFPYITLGGQQVVTMLNFKDGKWQQRYGEQNIQFWKPIDIPREPEYYKKRFEP